MALADLSQPIMFLLFLVLFVLLGIYPAWQKTAAIIRKFLAASNRPDSTDKDILPSEPTNFVAKLQPTLQLDTLESIVFQRFVMTDGKSLSRKQINADLHLEPAHLKTALDSLLHRGLLQITITALPIIRFQLTEQGRDYAQDSGAITSFR